MVEGFFSSLIFSEQKVKCKQLQNLNFLRQILPRFSAAIQPTSTQSRGGRRREKILVARGNEIFFKTQWNCNRTEKPNQQPRAHKSSRYIYLKQVELLGGQVGVGHIGINVMFCNIHQDIEKFYDVHIEKLLFSPMLGFN